MSETKQEVIERLAIGICKKYDMIAHGPIKEGSIVWALDESYEAGRKSAQTAPQGEAPQPRTNFVQWYGATISEERRGELIQQRKLDDAERNKPFKNPLDCNCEHIHASNPICRSKQISHGVVSETERIYPAPPSEAPPTGVPQDSLDDGSCEFCGCIPTLPKNLCRECFENRGAGALPKFQKEKS